jgi:glycosyltransferase involved in cell wall biosynthesis
VDSVLSQTVSPARYEVLIVDDGSTDNTVEFISQAYGDDSRVRLIRQENRGVAAARNRGLKEAVGEFIAYLDHDDIWLPEKLEKQLAQFDGRPSVGVVSCHWLHVDNEGRPLPDFGQTTKQPFWTPPKGYIYHTLVRQNLIVSMSVPLIRVDMLRRIGGFDPRTVPCDDYDVWLRMARHWEFDHVPDTLVLYTHHAAQQSRDMQLMMRAELRTLKKQWPIFIRNPKYLSRPVLLILFSPTIGDYNDAKAALVDGDFSRVRQLIMKTVRKNPLSLTSKPWLYLIWRLIKKNRNAY